MPEIKYYTLNDGLSQVSINAICKDKRGFLWLGTQNGLNRFDGSSFKIFKKDEFKSGSICGNYINVIFEDSRGFIWVGTENEGICYYDPVADLFIQPELSINAPRLTVTAISEDPFGRIFIAFDNFGIGIYSFENKKPGEFRHVSGSDTLMVSTLCIASDSLLWVGTRNGMLFSSTLSLDCYPELILNATMEQSYITTIVNDVNHEIYVGTRTGLYHYNSIKTAIEPVLITNGNMVTDFGELLIYDVTFESNDRCWIATGDGLFETKKEKGNKRGLRVVNSYKANKNDGSIISNNTVFCVEPDTENGLLWIGTGKYLNLLIEKKPFYKLESVTGDPQSLSSSVVFSVLKVRNKLWVGTSDGGLNMVEDGHFYHFNEAQLGLPNNPVFSLAVDHFENLWIGTKSGLTVIRRSEIESHNVHFSAITHRIDDPESLSDNFTRKVFVDKKNNIWICTQLGGLNRFTGDLVSNHFTFQKFRSNENNKESIASDKIYCMIEDRMGNYWLGTDAGLNKLTFKTPDYTNPEFRLWSYNPDSINGLCNNTVYSIAEDEDGILWLGTRNGLNRFNPFNETFMVYNRESGLPDNVIYSVLTDKSDNVWVSTNNGLSRLDKETMRFVNYSENDGLLAREFNLNSHYVGEDGMLYFGCINGLNMFFPDSLKKIDQIKELTFTDLEYNVITKDDKSRYTSAVISESLKLSYKNFPFLIKFTDVDIRPYKDISFAYRLLPNNSSWNNIGQNREIQFPRLAPGNYVIEIQGITRGNIWDVQPLTLKLHVTPPWWGSLWAYMAYVLVFLSAVYFVYLKRLQSILSVRETHRLKELSDFKNKFFTDITHEFRTPLTVIMGLARNVKSKFVNQDRVFTESLGTIERNGEVLLQLVNQMLDLARLDRSGLVLKPVHADVIPYLQYVFECFDSAARIKNINIWFYKECTSLFMDFDPEHLHKVISNLLSNAVIHTPENGKILMHVNYNIDLNTLIVKVQNSGKGIPENEIQHIFERFYTKTTTDYNNGMGIGLSLSLELTKLMGGDISVKNLPEDGVEFLMLLPVTKNAPLNQEKKTPHIIVPNLSQKPLNQTDQIGDDDSKLLVLVIEDNRDVSEYIRMCLSETYRVHCCYDGYSGMESAFSLIPDLIISDIMMPGVTGIEVCSILKNDRRSCHIPVILLTALSENSDKIKGLTAGADVYLKKPFDETELLVRIEKLIELRQKIQEKYRYVSDETSPVSLDDSFISEAIHLIQDHLSEIQFKTTDLAFLLKLSESQLYRKIKALSGRSTALFIRYIRLQESQKFLTNTDKSISEVAYLCGFSDPAWFSRSFKDEFGYSPTEFRGKGKSNHDFF